MKRALLLFGDLQERGGGLVCPHCGGEMRFLSVIEEPLVIDRILCHLGLWAPRPPEEGDWPVNGQIPLTYEPLPAIA